MKSLDSDVHPDPSRVEQVFHAAAALAVDQQPAFLMRECGGDERLESAVRALLAASRDAVPAWDGNALELEARHSALAKAATRHGELFGPYRIIRRIAGGGMGVVYEAVRDDAEFQKRVAIKLVEFGLDDTAGVERFRSERQILAELEHPNIARLLDGGTTDEGCPYLVMEYVDGQPIDRFAAERRLSRADRLTLFLQVCDAVQYAHRNLVVHRDLKPDNILVTPDAVPKLLDFGIAKLLSGDARAPATTMHALTPAFASPEQMLGRSVGTATDVYSLGVLLFVLLTDRAPYRVPPSQTADFVKAICEEEPVWQPAGLVDGDLHSVLAQALRKEPERRYLSVEQFAADVRRYLEGRPVAARPDAVLYRARKFIVRRAVPLAAATALLAAIVAGTVSTVVQSRRAQRRFDEVRQLANTLIFKIHDAVAPLAGSTPVRQMIVNEGLAYLERLTVEAHGDPQLQLEIARAYIKIGSVQGRPQAANLGDRAGAISSFRKAEAILRPMATVPGASVPVIGAYVDAAIFLSETLAQVAGQSEEAPAAARLAVDVADALARRQPSSDEARSFLASAYFAVGRVADGVDKLTYWQRAVQVYRALLAERPGDAARQRSVALAEKYIGSYFETDGDFTSALEHHRAALQLDEERARGKPDDRLLKFDLAIDLSNIAFAQWHVGDLAAAEALYQRSLALREQLASTDPKDVLARGRVAFVHRQLGLVNDARGLTGSAVAHLREAVRLTELMDLSTLDTRRNLAHSLSNLGRLEPNRTDACRAASRAVDLYNSMTDKERTVGLQEDPLPTIARQAAACGVSRGSPPLPTTSR